jgi:hypothetical protein
MATVGIIYLHISFNTSGNIAFWVAFDKDKAPETHTSPNIYNKAKTEL